MTGNWELSDLTPEDRKAYRDEQRAAVAHPPVFARAVQVAYTPPKRAPKPVQVIARFVALAACLSAPFIAAWLLAPIILQLP